MPTQAGHTQIKLLQVIRAGAVVLVVLDHFGMRNNLAWTSGLGAYGLNLFFVLSGFIIPVSIRDTDAWKFFKRRLLRIVPMYWICTTLKLAAVLLPSVKGVAPRLVLASFLFIPARNYYGDMLPILPVGWSLEVEMLFYLLIAACLVCLGRRALGIAFLSALVVAFELRVNFYASAMPAFAMGLSLAFRFRERGYPAPFFRKLLIPALAGIILLGWGAASHHAATVLLLATCIVGVALEIEPLIGGWTPRWLVVLGDASYSIYLTHWLLMQPLDRLARLKLPPTELTLAQSLIAVLIGVVSYLIVERPILRATRGRRNVEPNVVIGSLRADASVQPLQPSNQLLS